MAPKSSTPRLQDLSERHEALVETVHRLAVHTSVLAIAVRDPGAVPSADLDAAFAGIAEITATIDTRR